MSSISVTFCRKLDRLHRGVTPKTLKNGTIVMLALVAKHPEYNAKKSLTDNLKKILGVSKATAQAIGKIKATTRTGAIREMAKLLKLKPKEVDTRW